MNQQDNFENLPENNLEDNSNSFEVAKDSEYDIISNDNFVISDDGYTNKKPKKRKKKKSKIKRILFWILITFLVLILSGIITLFVMIQIGKSSLLNTDGMKIDPGSTVSDLEVDDDGRTIEYNGKKYAYNEDMTAILFIGVDKESISEEIGLNGSNGQADALFLYAMDTSSGKSTVIPISRDTMTDIDIYSGEGKYLSSSKKQICLAYAYGDGKEKSCENTVEAVSRLFYGLPINSYVAIDLESIAELTESVDGIEVVPNEDFEYFGHKFYKGQKTTLKGEKARVYVQGRDQVKLDANLNRMARQKQVVTAFFSKAVSKTKQNLTFPVDVYNTTKQYMITDIDVSEISFLASCVVMNDLGLEYKSIEGEMVMGEKYAEYHVNNQSVYDTVVDVFYKPVS